MRACGGLRCWQQRKDSAPAPADLSHAVVRRTLRSGRRGSQKRWRFASTNRRLPCQARPHAFGNKTSQAPEFGTGTMMGAGRLPAWSGAASARRCLPAGQRRWRQRSHLRGACSPTRVRDSTLLRMSRPNIAPTCARAVLRIRKPRGHTYVCQVTKVTLECHVGEMRGQSQRERRPK